MLIHTRNRKLYFFFKDLTKKVQKGALNSRLLTQLYCANTHHSEEIFPQISFSNSCLVWRWLLEDNL